MDLINTAVAMKQASLTSQVQMSVARKMLDHQEMQGAAAIQLIEAAGKEYVGANIDPGNAVWALEEPLRHLEVLGPLTICSSVRDTTHFGCARQARANSRPTGSCSASGPSQNRMISYIRRP